MVYVLEDELNIRELVVYSLKNSGLDAQGFGTAREFWQAVKVNLPSLVLLDIMLPDENGLSVLQKLRQNGKTAALPVIMLTAKGTEFDKASGLDKGADDYIAKPFGVLELTARVKSLLRRTSPPKASVQLLERGGLSVNLPKRTVMSNGKEVPLTLKEFELLVFLMKNSGVVLTRENIMSAVWGQDFLGETRTVDVHIRTLRQKLKGCEDLIETVRGVGYKISE
jgi:two-component system alkaline phosphatase synthesis response regulator PhoP